MNIFDQLYDTKTLAEKFGVTNDYIGRVLRGKHDFPESFSEGLDYKYFGKTIVVAESGMTKLDAGFRKIRSKK